MMALGSAMLAEPQHSVAVLANKAVAGETWQSVAEACPGDEAVEQLDDTAAVTEQVGTAAVLVQQKFDVVAKEVPADEAVFVLGSECHNRLRHLDRLMVACWTPGRGSLWEVAKVDVPSHQLVAVEVPLLGKLKAEREAAKAAVQRASFLFAVAAKDIGHSYLDVALVQENLGWQTMPFYRKEGTVETLHNCR